MNSNYSYINWKADNRSLYNQISMEAAMLDMENESPADFLSYGLDRNTCLFVMVMKQYDSKLTEEERQQLQEKLTSKIEKAYLSTDVPYVANICLTLLYLEDYATLSDHLKKANRKIYHAADQKRFSTYCNDLLFTDLFNNQQRIFFLNLKYRNLSAHFSGNDIFMTEKTLPVNFEVNDDLLELFKMAFANSDYAYLNSLIDIAPSLTLEKLRISREQLKSTATTVVNDFTRFMAFSQTMMNRCSNELDDKLANLEYWHDEIITQLSVDNSYDRNVFDLYYMCQRIIIDPEHAADFLKSSAKITAIDRGLNNFVIKQAEEQAFHALFRTDCTAIPPLIEQLAESNLFRYIPGKDYVSSVTVSDTVLSGYIASLKGCGFEETEIIHIYMNSPLRSILRMLDFLRLLYYPEITHSDKSLFKYLNAKFAQYAFIGKPAYNKHKEVIMMTHSYRNNIEPVGIYVPQDYGQNLSTMIRKSATVVFHLRRFDYDPASGMFKLRLTIDDNEELVQSYVPAIDLNTEDRHGYLKILDNETDRMKKLQMIITFYRDGKIFRDDFNRQYAEAIEHVPRLFSLQLQMNDYLLQAIFASDDNPSKVKTLIEGFRFKRNYFRYGSCLNDECLELLREILNNGEMNAGYPEQFQKLVSRNLLPVFEHVNLYTSSPLRYMITLADAYEMMKIDIFRRLFSKGLFLNGQFTELNPDGSAEYCHLAIGNKTIHVIPDDPEAVIIGQNQRILIHDRLEDGSFSCKIITPENEKRL